MKVIRLFICQIDVFRVIVLNKYVVHIMSTSCMYYVYLCVWHQLYNLNVFHVPVTSYQQVNTHQLHDCCYSYMIVTKGPPCT